MEKCLFLQSAEAEASPACTTLQTHVFANLDKSDVKVVHNRYRDYVMRNREALSSFKQTVQNDRLPMPLIIYSSGSGKDAPRAIRTISNLPLGSGPIESEWNTRSLKQGTIPIVHPPPVVNPITPISLCLLKSDGSTIGEAGDLPILHPDDAATHLDHYHLSITGR